MELTNINTNMGITTQLSNIYVIYIYINLFQLYFISIHQNRHVHHVIYSQILYFYVFLCILIR